MVLNYFNGKGFSSDIKYFYIQNKLSQKEIRGSLTSENIHHSLTKIYNTLSLRLVSSPYQHNK